MNPHPNTAFQRELVQTNPITWGGLAHDPCRDWVGSRTPLQALMECEQLDWMYRIFLGAIRADRDLMEAVLMYDAQQRGVYGHLEDDRWVCDGACVIGLLGAYRAIDDIFDRAESWAREQTSAWPRDNLTMLALKREVQGVAAMIGSRASMDGMCSDER